MLTDFYPPMIGGMERHVSVLSRELAKRGHEIIVFTTGETNLYQFDKDCGVKLIRLESLLQKIPFLYKNQQRRYLPPIRDLLITDGLKAVIEHEKPDIIHSHGWIVYSILPLKRQYAIPLIVTLHDYGLICPKKTLIIRRKICNNPFTSRCMSCGVESYGAIKSSFAYYGVKSNKRNLRFVDKYIAVSSFVKEAYCNYLNINEKDIIVIPNFYQEGKKDQECQKCDMMPDDFILYIGVLTRDKGIDVLLEAYGNIDTKIKLVIIGTKHPAYSYKGRDGVTIIENAPDEVVNEAYKRCRFTVIPSIYPDPCPTVALEAMSKKRAIIGSNIGGLKDIIENGDNGILVPPNDTKDLAEAMAYLWSNRSICLKMGERGHMRLINQFNPEKVVQEIEAQYQGLIKR